MEKCKEGLAVPKFDNELPAYYKGGTGHMVFRCRIFENDPFIVIVLTESNKNPGMSISNGIEVAIASVFARFAQLRIERSVIIEHYEEHKRVRRNSARDAESFNLLTFDPPLHKRSADKPRDGEPVWTRITKSEVEQLIGGRLP